MSCFKNGPFSVIILDFGTKLNTCDTWYNHTKAKQYCLLSLILNTRISRDHLYLHSAAASERPLAWVLIQQNKASSSTSTPWKNPVTLIKLQFLFLRESEARAASWTLQNHAPRASTFCREWWMNVHNESGCLWDDRLISPMIQVHMELGLVMMIDGSLELRWVYAWFKLYSLMTPPTPILVQSPISACSMWLAASVGPVTAPLPTSVVETPAPAAQNKPSMKIISQHMNSSIHGVCHAIEMSAEPERREQRCQPSERATWQDICPWALDPPSSQARLCRVAAELPTAPTTALTLALSCNMQRSIISVS